MSEGETKRRWAPCLWNADSLLSTFICWYFFSLSLSLSSGFVSFERGQSSSSVLSKQIAFSLLHSKESDYEFDIQSVTRCFLAKDCIYTCAIWLTAEPCSQLGAQSFRWELDTASSVCTHPSIHRSNYHTMDNSIQTKPKATHCREKDRHYFLVVFTDVVESVDLRVAVDALSAQTASCRSPLRWRLS